MTFPLRIMISNINSYILNEIQLEKALEKSIMLRKVENRRECIRLRNRIKAILRLSLEIITQARKGGDGEHYSCHYQQYETSLRVQKLFWRRKTLLLCNTNTILLWYDNLVPVKLFLEFSINLSFFFVYFGYKVCFAYEHFVFLF